ncbi:MAG: TAT-variant-translocated molybdopterin oxidoreductase [Acidobacteriota bacterium]
MAKDKKKQPAKFWRSLAEKQDPAAAAEDARSEFAPEVLKPIQPPSEKDPVSRRRFLSLMGASAALAATVACQKPDEKTIVPYTKKPRDVIPGVANYYASTYQEGRVPYGVLIKTREGRPIHIDGNDEHPVFNGKTSLRAQAEVIGLYSPDRLRGPKMDGRPSNWKAANDRIISALKKASGSGKEVLLLTPAVISPTRRKVIEAFKSKVPNLRHVEWEPALSPTAEKAAESLYGKALTPVYHLEAANVILAAEADFLGAMESQVTSIAGYAARRRLKSPDEPISRLYAVEGAMSLTGTKADQRLRLRPSHAARFLFAVAGALHGRHGVALPAGFPAGSLAPFVLDDVVKQQKLGKSVVDAMVADLAREGKHSLVMAGPSLPAEAHVAAELINVMLGVEGTTVETAYSPDPVPLASTAEVSKLASEMSAGKYGLAVFWDVNPLYALPGAEAFQSAMKKVPLNVRLGLEEDETAEACQIVLPVNHWMESWGDYEAAANLLSLQQPVIRPLYDTKPAEEILLAWTQSLGGDVQTDYRKYLMARWQSEVYPKGTFADFDQFWTAAVHDGILRRNAQARPPRSPRAAAFTEAAGKAASEPSDALELLLAPDKRLWDGRYGNIGWLQELPEPVTKMSWENVLAFSPADAKKMDLSDGDLVKVAAGSGSVVLPALIQPGQAEGVVFTTLGYGRTPGSVASGVGANTFVLQGGEAHPFFSEDAKVTATGDSKSLVRTQHQFRLLGREEYITHLWSMDTYAKEAAKPKKKVNLATLYPKERFPNHKWGMVIDQSACVGCTACEIACQSENNIPVVGPDRVAKGRIMHWIRIDTYYKGDPSAPEVFHQPMLCQQCDDAPCENVCPVAATMHDDEGLNVMVYNRCVGTRYCSNNCPYKVRRFNFFDYTSFIKDPLDLAFNPEVTVRPRGVMEKCTFCLQRIRNGEQVAKDQHRPVRDGEIRPACAVACPAEAIVFGDLKDENSRVSNRSESNRGYKVLEDLGVRPGITYLAELRNPATKREEKNV